MNGGRSRDEHPAVPLTPEELAQAAREAVAAGAGAVHVHPRNADGRETLEPEHTDAAVAAVRAACPGLPVGVTTGLWIAASVEDRAEKIAGWRSRPDFASVNVYEAGADDLMRLLLDRGVGVEAGLATAEDADAFAASPVAASALRALVEPEDEDSDAAVERAAAMAAVLQGAGVPQLHHGEGVATWAVIDAALAAGHDVRVGLEDTLVLRDGRTARDNAELVAEV